MHSRHFSCLPSRCRTGKLDITSTSPLYFTVRCSLFRCCLRSWVDFFGSPRRQRVLSRRGLRGGGVARSLDSQVTCHQLVSVTHCSVVVSCGHTHPSRQQASKTTTTTTHNNNTHNTQQHNNENNNNTIWGGSVLTGEEPPPYSGGVQACSLPKQAAQPNPQLSRPMSSRHLISMEHRLRRK